jgi:predicted ATPase
MRIIEYHYRDIEEPGWDYSNVKFGKINLLVGDTATGKSRFLNTIFNLCRFIASKEFRHGHWDIVFEHSGDRYTWNIETGKKEDSGEKFIKQELLFKHDGNHLIQIIKRNNNEFIFNDKQLPKLSFEELSLSLLKEEDLIKPLYEGLTLIKRRLFDKDALSAASNLSPLSMGLISEIEKHRDLKKLFLTDLNLSSTLYILLKYFNEIYNLIIEQYKQFFPFIRETRVTDLSKVNPNIALPGLVPIFSIKEHGANKWVNIDQMSSGMQKILLILTDIFIIPKEGVYLIDEYENSLGISAIDFFPQFILNLEKDIQFFITSHHPYIINEIPPKNWYIFHREGMQVSIMYGEKVSERFGKSKQKAFIQLINDPFFVRKVQ